MSLKERAIAEYEESKRLRKDSDAREAEIFASKAILALQDVIGVQNVDITTVDRQPGCTSFRVDHDNDMLFIVSTSEGYHIINMVRKCDVCGTDVSNRITRIEDIGRALKKPHDKYHCDKALETRMIRENDENVDTVDERLLKALKDFMCEHSDVCVR